MATESEVNVDGNYPGGWIVVSRNEWEGRRQRGPFREKRTAMYSADMYLRSRGGGTINVRNTNGRMEFIRSPMPEFDRPKSDTPLNPLIDKEPALSFPWIISGILFVMLAVCAFGNWSV